MPRAVVKAAGLTRELLRQVAGARAFERGAAYVASQRVSSLVQDEGRITAQVRGTRAYRTALWIDKGKLKHSCTCPVGDDGICCKHCVAVGLAWLGEATHSLNPKQPAKAERKAKVQRSRKQRPVTMKDVRTHLTGATKETIIELLMDHALGDDRLRQRLFLETARSATRGVNLETYRAAIEDAVDTGDFVEYGAAFDYVQRIDEVIDSIDTLMAEGHATAVMELSEYALDALERAAGSVDDSDGYMGALPERLQRLHLAACVAAQPDPAALARKLFSLELNGPWDVFLGAATTYADVLGETGLTMYRELADAVWSRIPTLGPGDEDSIGIGTRHRITHMMETLATRTGDIDALVAVKRRNLSLPYDFLKIAEIYERDGQHDLALKWAERGAKAFPQRPDPRLLEFLANAYHRAKRHGEAMKLVWRAFEQSPHLETYQDLKRHATLVRQWTDWRERALAVMRAVAPADTRPRGRRLPWKRHPDHSELVRVFLWERKVESAWREAVDGGCSADLWMVLARKREVAHPKDSLPVYQQAVDSCVARMNNAAYRDAVGMLRDVRRLMVNLGREDDFAPYVASVRAKYRAKRNFVKMIDGARF